MPITNKWGLGTALLDATKLRVRQQSMPLNHTIADDVNSGQIWPQFLGIRQMGPTARLVTPEVLAALTQVGLYSKIGSWGAGMKLYARKHQSGGARMSTGRELAILDGMIALDALTVNVGDDAELALAVTMVSADGVTLPYTLANAVTTPVPGEDIRYSLGPVTIGNVAITHLRGIELNFALTIVPEYAPGDTLPTFASVSVGRPELVLRSIDLSLLKENDANFISSIGTTGTHANTSVFLRKRLNRSTFVPDATLDHIKLSLAGMVVPDNAIDVSGEDAAEMTLRMRTEGDDGTPPVQITTGIAIP